ncbi:hypothetical protein HanRHA438_Chr06g0283391 [Helianthus annuus]|nr:hypothetical protein HanRHA438_Chr06g0283391 [Helianthus annuus]
MMADFVAFGLTGSVCLKSPPNNTDFPPKGSHELSSISLSVLSSDSKHRLSLMGASSQIIREVSLRSCASWVFFFTSQRESSVNSRGILNLE